MKNSDKKQEQQQTIPANSNNLIQNRYITGLDGLRAIAVLAVIAYHLNFQWAGGGLLGVAVFFVLSGYLITDLLIAEYANTQKIDLKSFWIRRARRLLPAMFTMILVVITYVISIQPSMLHKLKEDTLAAVFYVSNWWYIFQDLSYFESFGPPSLLTHFWSLAVEEQFYIVWPLLILVFIKLRMRETALFFTILLLSIISAVLMGILYEPGTDPSRVYYGTDTRAFSILIGASLAVIWPSRKLSGTLPKSMKFKLDFIGLTAIAFIFYMVWKTNQYQDFLYQGGMVALSVASALVVAVIVHPASMLNKCLSFRPLRWIGMRSYGIYLWHYPVLVLTSPQWGAAEPNLIRTSLQMAAIFIISSLSYTFIENPIRRGALKKIYFVIKQGDWKCEKRFVTRFVVLTGIFFILLGISTAGLTTSIALGKDNVIDVIQEKVGIDNPPTENKAVKEKQNIPEKKKKEKDIPKDMPKDETSHKSQTNTKPSTKTEQPEQKPEPSKPAQDNRTITVIGDSVMIEVTPNLEEMFPNVDVDAKIGRQFREAKDIIQQKKSNGKLGKIVVLELGANGPIPEEKLIELLDQIGTDHQVYLSTTRVPKPWEREVNDTLTEVSKKFNNTTLVDWYSVSRSHPEYIGDDGVHLTLTGARAYANMLIKQIEE